MHKVIIAGAAISALALGAIAGTASASPVEQNVQSLSGMSPWIASNSTVIKTPDGVHFGTYADGGAVGGSMVHKVSGMKLSDVEDYSFTFNYKQAGNLSGATPYARIFLDTDHNGTTDADVILDPSKGGLVTPEQSVDQTFGTDDDSVRYDDDAGSSAQQSWSDVKQAHGDDKIVSILVSQGYSMGTDVSAMVKTVRFNGVCYKFNVAPRDGSDGEDGTNGTNGAAGSNGHDGTNGAAGSNGTNGRNGVDGAAGVNGQDGKNAGSTTIVNDHTATYKVSGATMRTLHVKGKHLVSVKATLRGKAMHTHGRSISVDLRGKAVGNYNVVITAKYSKGGKTHTVRSIRSLSITR